MDILEFLFLLLEKYVPMRDSKLKRLMLDGRTWYNDLGGDGSHPLLIKFKFISELWFVQLVLGCLYIYADKALHKYITAPKVDHEDDDDDDDDEDDDDQDDDHPASRRVRSTRR